MRVPTALLKVMRLLSFLAGLVLPAHASADGEPDTGLLWNRTGLPLAFPLIVRAEGTRAYHLLLTEADTGAGALAAYLRRGEVLRLLVPPGRYGLTLTGGEAWTGGALLFRDREVVLEVPDPLRFAIEGGSRKQGHSIDISQSVEDAALRVLVSDIAICQALSGGGSARQVVPPATSEPPRDPVGQEILKRRFERGADTFEVYDRQRQQRDYDPPVLGLPQVPLARPGQDAPPVLGPVPGRSGGRLVEWWC